MDLIKLFNAAENDWKLNGYIGLDYNMAVMCIIAKRTEIKVNFMAGGIDSYEDKLDYWANKRDFCHLHVDSEDELLTHAAKEYSI